jgi:hypothetical protein
MATADYPVECPQCGFDEACGSFNTHQWEGHTFCPMCGYMAWTKAVIDRKRQATDPERKAYFKLDKRGERIFRTYERKGYGAYYVTSQSGIANLGALRVPVTRRVIAQFRRDIAGGGINQSACWLTRWTGKQVEFVVGVDPRAMMNSIKNSGRWSTLARY